MCTPITAKHRTASRFPSSHSTSHVSAYAPHPCFPRRYARRLPRELYLGLISLDSVNPKRLASSYAPVQLIGLDTNSYPSGITSFLPSIHDLRLYQGLLANSANYSTSSKCDIFEISGGVGSWRENVDDKNLSYYLQSWQSQPSKSSTRLIFSTSTRAPKTSFGLQISLSQEKVKEIVRIFGISPQFVPLLLGEPDYWAPGHFETYGDTKMLERIEFFCQQPRWNIHNQQIPWCIYMLHQVQDRTTTYLIGCGEQYSSSDTLKRRLVESFDGAANKVTSKTHLDDPFLVHCMILHQSLVEAKDIVTRTRHRLYDQLDLVDEYAKMPSDRRNPKDFTVALHSVSQDIDSLLASADMADMIAERMLAAHSRACTQLGNTWPVDKVTNTADSIRYLQASIQAQRRWLLSYKARKDIALNLVFNLVTQQDSQANVSIAQKTKVDSSAMTTIAFLTMLFLPATFMAAVFALPFLRAARWWYYMTSTVALTTSVMLFFKWWILRSRHRDLIRPSSSGVV